MRIDENGCRIYSSCDEGPQYVDDLCSQGEQMTTPEEIDMEQRDTIDRLGRGLDAIANECEPPWDDAGQVEHVIRYINRLRADIAALRAEVEKTREHWKRVFGLVIPRNRDREDVAAFEAFWEHMRFHYLPPHPTATGDGGKL
jgi:hypothetical protein